MIQSTPVRRITLLVILLTLFLIPITDSLRAAPVFDHIPLFADGEVNTDYLNVRNGPGVGYGVIGSARRSEAVHVVSQVSNCQWLEVSLFSGARGWVFGPLIALYRPCGEFSPSLIAAESSDDSTYHKIPSYHAAPPPYQQPTYDEPIYEQPPYQPSAYQPPAYQRPAYQRPAYSAPLYAKPGYQQPYYQQPIHEVPGKPYVSPHVASRNAYVNLTGPLSSELVGLHEFSWQANFPLGYGEAFELVFWQVGQDPMIHGFSPLEASGATTVLVDLEESIRRIPQLQNGFDYVWSVLLVQTHPYQRLSLLSSGHQFRLERFFKDSSNNDNGNSNGGSPPTSKPEIITQPPTEVPSGQTPVSTPFIVGTFTPTNTPTRIPTRTPTPTPEPTATPEP